VGARETMSDDPEVPVVCPECETTTAVPLADLPEAVTSHNDRLHDGEEVATVDPELVEQVRDIAASELLADEG